MANYLILNQNYVQNGLGTLSFIAPATGNYNVSCEVTIPTSAATGAGAGSAADQGLGATGGSQGIGQGSNLSLGNGGLGLGFGGTANDNASGNGSGYGAGAGGGAEGFSAGDQGLGEGGVGQGFGPSNGYQQPPAYTNTPTSVAGISSSLVMLVKDNGSTVFTAPVVSPTQGSAQWRTSLVVTSGHTITVVFTSANANDNTLNAIKSNISIGQGL